MILTIEAGNRDDFTLNISSKDGAEPFLSIRNCRIVEGGKGRFVSLPAKKLDSGKYFNLVRASDAFQAAILKVYDAQAPKPATRDDFSDAPF